MRHTTPRYSSNQESNNIARNGFVVVTCSGGMRSITAAKISGMPRLIFAEALITSSFLKSNKLTN